MIVMTDKTPRPRHFDPLTTAAVVFFLLAVALAAAPALRAGPATLAGLMLLIGLAGVACLGLIALRGVIEPVPEGEPGADRLIEALPEPAAPARLTPAVCRLTSSITCRCMGSGLCTRQCIRMGK